MLSLPHINPAIPAVSIRRETGSALTTSSPQYDSENHDQWHPFLPTVLAFPMSSVDYSTVQRVTESDEYSAAVRSHTGTSN